MNFVAVHAGAGFHSETNRTKYTTLCKQACEAGMKAIQDGAGSALDAVAAATVVFEDNELTNAGYGSNLCDDGTVECDASIMNGSTLAWAGVGAVPGIKNPILIAKLLLEKQKQPLPCGLISPNVLVGEGARKWALKNGCPPSDNLVAERSRKMHAKYKRRLVSAEAESAIKRERLDTVGVIAIDSHGITASGVSTGGLVLKHPGRVGQAGMFGCGCWAQDNVAVSTTGVGEYLMKTIFAKECGESLLNCTQNEALVTDALRIAFDDKFLHSAMLRDIKKEDKSAGVIGTVFDEETSSVELVWAHNTPTMCIGYMSSAEKTAKAVFSQSSSSGSLMVQAISLRK